MTTYYRIHESHGSTSVHLYVEKLQVLSRTPRGVWVGDAYSKRFILDGEGKRYAYPTVEQAHASFIRRKERQIVILTAQLQRAENALTCAKAGVEELEFNPSCFSFSP